jgi:hypothetical protein
LARDFPPEVPQERPRVRLGFGAGSGLGVGDLLSRVRGRLAAFLREDAGGGGVDSLRSATDRLAARLETLDTSGDGTVGLGELRDGLRAFGVTLADRELVALLAFFDADGSGRVAVEELVSGLRGDRDDAMPLTFTVTRVGDGGGSGDSLGGGGADSAAVASAERASHGGPTALVRVRFVDGREDDVEVSDPVGFTAADEPAIRARLRAEGWTGVHSVTLLVDGKGKGRRGA